MSNKFRNDPNPSTRSVRSGQVEPAKFQKPRAIKDDFAAAVPVSLPDALLVILLICRSLWSRWDLHTIPENLRPQNPGYKENMLKAASAFFASLEAFDACTTFLFAAVVSQSLAAGEPRTELEAGIYTRWREQFRNMRAALGAFLKAMAKSPVQFCTIYDEFWPPLEVNGASQRPENAVLCETGVMVRIKQLQANLEALDKLLQQKAPSLLLEVPAGPVQG